MGKDVDQLAERVTHVEAAHAPRFVDRAVFDGEPGRFIAFSAASTSSTSIDRSGVGVPEPPCDATLIWTVICSRQP